MPSRWHLSRIFMDISQLGRAGDPGAASLHDAIVSNSTNASRRANRPDT
jgi:hypothetical protein